MIEYLLIGISIGVVIGGGLIAFMSTQSYSRGYKDRAQEERFNAVEMCKTCKSKQGGTI